MSEPDSPEPYERMKADVKECLLSKLDDILVSAVVFADEVTAVHSQYDWPCFCKTCRQHDKDWECPNIDKFRELLEIVEDLKDDTVSLDDDVYLDRDSICKHVTQLSKLLETVLNRERDRQTCKPT